MRRSAILSGLGSAGLLLAALVYHGGWGYSVLNLGITAVGLFFVRRGQMEADALDAEIEAERLDDFVPRQS
jgi:hypothetical protein